MGTMFLQNALYFAWSDTRARYKNSILGPLWLTLANLIGVLGLSIVWAALLRENAQTFIPSLAIGLIIWQLVAGIVAEAPSVFIRHANIIKNVTVPPWFFVFRMFSRHLINFLHNMIIVIGIIWYFDIPLHIGMLMMLPGTILVLVNLLWIAYALSMAGARFRDFEHIINLSLPFLFFISPVIFRPDHFPINPDFIWLNPLTYFIEIIRMPFLGNTPDPGKYCVLILMLATGSLLCYLLNRFHSSRLAFWI